ncbi:hypothetical protein OIU76_004788 [Salix suchowensis]|nr:hypothetical protein OIU76_004788 [Salix suchowensis]
MASLLLAPRMDVRKAPSQNELLNFGTRSNHQFQLSHELSANTDFSMGIISEQAISTTSSDHRTSNSKKCKFLGCSKGARGASGLCIGHGGGQRCQKPGCDKGGVGFQVDALRLQEANQGFVLDMAGGRGARLEAALAVLKGQAGLCISHGGGRRCEYQGCSKGAQGSTGYCKAHGGGKRCIFAGCTKGAEGSTPLCKGHGGGKRCLFDGGGICPKSVHGGTNFCVAHGGGKRCVVPGCTKSARGRTDCCVRHGGGKRCRVENCGKSAQGSTDFCKAHGGGKRCTWGEGKCEKFARGKSGLCAAHSSMVLEREANKTGLIRPGLFHGLVSAAASTAGSSIDNNHSYSGVSVVSDCSDSLEKPAKRLHLIPPQVLVPQSMKASSSFTSCMNADKLEEGTNGYGASSGGIKNFNYLVP